MDPRSLVDIKYRYFLYDLGYELRQRALAAKEQARTPAQECPAGLFESGRLLAFNEVISVMQQMAVGFDIPLEELQLAGIDPDRDLT